MVKSKKVAANETVEVSTAVSVPNSVGLLTGREAQQEALPAFMRGETTGTDDLDEFIVPPRLKVVQGTASEEIKSQFNEGDLIISPSLQLIAPVRLNEHHKPDGHGEPFAFVPVLFFVEYLVENPIEYKGTENYIRDRSLDPNSEIARKCRDPQQWTAPHPERPTTPEGKAVYIRYVECLNFVVLPLGIDSLAGMPIVISFSKSMHKAGSTLASLIKMRGAPIFGCVFQAQAVQQTNAQNSWYGLQISNPVMEDVGVGPTILDEAEYDYLKEKHLSLKGRVQVDYEEHDAQAVNSSADQVTLDATATSSGNEGAEGPLDESTF